MIVSKELQSQLDRLANIGAFSLSQPQKYELQKHVKEIGANELINLDCGSCVRRSMHDLNSYMKRSTSKPLLAFKGVKSNTELTFNQLRTKAKAKGFKATRTTSKTELIKFLSK